MRALSIAATGMSAQQMRVEVISNNLANMNTTAYNPRRAEFADLGYQQLTRPGAITATSGTMVPTGVQVGLGVRPTAVSMNINQGSLAQTGGDLDLAIDGKGYFEVTMPNGGSAYTRDGSFKRSGEGQIVTSQGYPLVPDITIPPDAKSIKISTTGEVYATFADRPAPELLGQITLTGFTNEKGLEALGDNLFAETAASGSPITDQAGNAGMGLIQQGYLENSSVDAVRQITDLIEAQRGYELNAKVITAADQMLAATTQIR